MGYNTTKIFKILYEISSGTTSNYPINQTQKYCNMTNAEEILAKYPSVKLGLDDHYGRQTVLNAINEALKYSQTESSKDGTIDKL